MLRKTTSRIQNNNGGRNYTKSKYLKYLANICENKTNDMIVNKRTRDLIARK